MENKDQDANSLRPSKLRVAGSSPAAPTKTPSVFNLEDTEWASPDNFEHQPATSIPEHSASSRDSTLANDGSKFVSQMSEREQILSLDRLWSPNA